MIYFRGCLSREKNINIPNATEKLLKQAKINYKTIGNEKCCGSVLLRTGFKDDALNIMEKTAKYLKDEKVLVSCAGCYRTFKLDYPEILGEEIDVIHTSQLFLELLEDENTRKIFEIDNSDAERLLSEELITYHDPCHLGRHMDEYEAPRQVIETFGKLVEMERNRENARCCGAGGGVRSAFPDLSAEIAKSRVEDAKDTGAKTLLTCQENNDDYIEVMDLSQFIVRRLKND